jgi:hypothetical protein
MVAFRGIYAVHRVAHPPQPLVTPHSQSPAASRLIPGAFQYQRSMWNIPNPTLLRNTGRLAESHHHHQYL